MANATNSHGCCFRWIISNPFLPLRKLKAIFYHESSTVTQWRLTLDTVNPRINHYEFSFSLEFCRDFERHNEIVAGGIAVRVSINGALVERKDVSNYRFSRENDFRYSFQYSFSTYPQIDPHHLVIEVRMDIPYRATREVEKELYFEDEDLMSLSINLEQLRNYPQFSNINLQPADNLPPIPAHSYIIGVRWKNLFKFHQVHPQEIDILRIAMSRPLLHDLLTYLYSGRIVPNWPKWEKLSYMTEFFRLLDTYKLYHLYKVFAKNDLRQVLVTENSAAAFKNMFPLNRTDGSAIPESRYMWDVNQTFEYMFRFRMRVVNEDGAVPWLTYSLKSRTVFFALAQVSMQVVKKVQNDYQIIFSLHEKIHNLAPSEKVESDEVTFRNCPGYLGFNSTHLGVRREIAQYFIRVYLKFSDLTQVNTIQSEDGTTSQTEMERFDILSDHMCELMEEKLYSDLVIRVHSMDDEEFQDNIHKGILVTRLPNWRVGFENIPPEADIPYEEVRSILSSDTLPSVVNYMYTGKVPQIPDSLLNEVEHFAETTWFRPLLRLVHRLRNRAM